jgi:hypothetical protein
VPFKAENIIARPVGAGKKPLAENISAQGLMDHIASIVTSK